MWEEQLIGRCRYAEKIWSYGVIRFIGNTKTGRFLGEKNMLLIGRKCSIYCFNFCFTKTVHYILLSL